MDRASIGPGETVALTIAFDPAKEPEFRGSLSVEYVGRSAGGAVFVSGLVELAVENEPVATGVALAEQRRESQP